MDEELSPRLQSLFDEAGTLPPEEREAFLSRACGDDRQLHERLTSLLACLDQGEDFLERPALGRVLPTAGADPAPGSANRLRPGGRIGPYEIKRLIGSGGMASVYLAERADAEFRREVAVKLIRPGMDTQSVIERFLLERQALASLDHPNIARLFDGGKTAEGIPYLVMEYIDGEPIADWCHHQDLDTDQRLNLLLEVLKAVSFAHRNLVIHRDLKPGNILVTREGTPKLLDFGIAKLLEPGALGAAVVVTTTTRRFFTPEYASPEQIRGLPVTPAADIYSMGVIAYELLTGQRPYHLTRRSAVEVESIVCEEQPRLPSEVAAGSQPDRLSRRLKGDLDNIVMMALRKEPERRYHSAEQFSEDIQRHLARHPILARKSTLRYRSARFVRRHLLGCAISALILVGGVLVLLSQWRNSAFEADRDLARGRLSRLAVSVSRSDLQLLLGGAEDDQFATLLEDQPEDLIWFADGLSKVCGSFHLWEAAAAWSARVLRACENSAAASGRVAEARLGWGTALSHLCRFQEAEEELRLALDGPGTTPVFQSAVLRELGNLLVRRGDDRESQAFFHRALQLLEPETGEQVEVARVRTGLDLGSCLERDGQSQEGRRQLEQAARRAHDMRFTVLEAEAHRRLGTLLWNTPDFNDAELEIRRALDLLLSQPAGNTERQVVDCLSDLAWVTGQTRSYGWPGMSSALTDNPSLLLWNKSYRTLIDVYGKQSLEVADHLSRLVSISTPTVAASQCPRTIAQYRLWLPAEHPLLVGPMLAYGAAHDQGPQQLKKGEQFLRDAVRIGTRRLAPGHWQTALAQSVLGLNLASQNRFEEGLALLNQSLHQVEARLGNWHPRTKSVLFHLREAYELAGQLEQSAAIARRLDSSRWEWPYGRVARDDDGSREGAANIDFEDDQITKYLVVEDDPERSQAARLWVFGRNYDMPWVEGSSAENFRLRVNDDPERELRFNVGHVFNDLRISFQWVPFEIPVSWLKTGRNSFIIYEAHDKDYRTNLPWEYNNLHVGVDTSGTDLDRSWWFGSHEKDLGCCAEMKLAAMEAEKPLDRSAPFIVEHAQLGARECQGELMIFLELIDP